MAYVTDIKSTGSFISDAKAWLAAASARFAARRLARETYIELSRLNDRELDDIGISRSDIPAIAAGHDPRAR